MANQWFKFYGGEFLSDTKIERLSAQERSCWLTILCLASVATEGGVIEFLTVETLLKKSGIDFDPYRPEEWEKSLGVLKKFQQMKMIELDEDGTLRVLNWEKRQESFLTGAERMKKYRSNPENTIKEKARVAVASAVKEGKLEKKPCEICGNEKSEAHHESYEQENWLVVKWFCKKHHEEIHSVTYQSHKSDARIEENRIEKNRINTVARKEPEKEEEILDQNSEWFEEFYKKYPNKVSKKKAQVSFYRIKGLDQAKFDFIMLALERYKSSPQWTKNNGDFVPHPTTWINQERWNDEIKEVKKTRVDTFSKN